MVLGLSMPLRQQRTVTLSALLLTCSSAWGADATGKVAWIDARNAALLLECISAESCASIPAAKTGETYTFVIPKNLIERVAALKEGQQVTVSYDDQKEKGYVLTAIK